MAKITISQSELEAWFNDYLKEQGQSRADWENSTPTAARQEIMYRRYRDAHPEIENREDLEIISDENSKKEENGNEGQDNKSNQDNQETNEPEAPTNQNNFTSDEWQQLISGEGTPFLTEQGRVGIDRVVLAQMNKLPENFDSLESDAQQDAINLAKANLNADERNEFNQRDMALKREILEYYPPKRLVDTSKWLEEAENHASTDAIRTEMEASRAIIMEVMATKINKYAAGETIVDQTNIADVYDGAKEMYQYVEEKNPNNEELKQNIETCRGKLEEQINIYDADNGFTDLTPENAHEINETFLRAQKAAENKDKIKTPPEELAHVWDNIEFEDDTKRQEFIESFNEAVVKKATMNVAVKHKGKKGDELDTALQEEITKNYVAELTAMMTANETAKHLAAEEQKRQANPSYVPQPMSEQQAKTAGQAAFVAVFYGRSGKYKIDNKVQTANFARYTNNAFGYLNRLGTKIGKKTNAVGNMAESVRKFDQTCIKRFDPYYSMARTQLKAMPMNMGRQALNQLVRYGSSLVPGGNILYGAYVGGQAIWRLGTKWSRLREEAKKNNRKFSTLGFLKDHVGEIATSALATGAALLGGAAAKDVAKGLGVAAMALGNITNVVKTFKREREKGEKWWKAGSVAIFSAALSTGTALGTSYGLGLAVNEAGLGTTSHDSVVTDRSEFDRLRALPEEELTKQGYTFEHCGKNDEGAFLIQEGKEGYTTRDYTQEELDFAKYRMEKLFDPNDTHTGGTRYSEHLGHDWTDKSYSENSDAYNNAINSINKLAASHSDMNSEIEGQQVSNSDMLLYKLYQANILAPNPDTVSDSGQPIGEVLSYTDENGNTTTYQDTYQKVINGQELTESDYQVLRVVEDHVGGQHEDGVNDMGKIKDFDNLGNGKNPDSYNKSADVGYELHDHPGQEDLYARITQHVEDPRDILPLTMVHDNQGENRTLAARVGANAKENQDKTPVDKTPVVVDDGGKKQEEPTQQKRLENLEKPIAGYLPTPEEMEEIKKRLAKKKEQQPQEDDKYGYGKLLADEYKIIYGVDPQVVDRGTPEKPDRAYQSWIEYNNRVDAERQATGRDIKMYDFLTERREKLDGMIAGLGDTHTTTVGVARDNRGVGAQDKSDSHNQPKNEISSKADYEKHKDNPAMAAVIADARQSMMQSNLTSDNYNHKVTLTHFMDYLGENLTHSSFVTDGTRDITKNPTLKRDIQRQEGEDRYFVADLNEFYFPQKEDTRSFDDKRKQIMVNNKENQEKGFWPTAKEVVGKMKQIFTNNHRNDPLYKRALESRKER